ncbi:class F sortase [uncultured Serinicoccus sp.]|uniref:class F sortase n=1 Tax=uncultured Serinicoccus sp. TaxID=735514 RepID=UPI00261D6A25|nr:class F sortase [uncultured Serinicoccus sp.]
MTDDVGRPGVHRAARRRGPLLPTVAALVLMLGGGTAVAVGVSGPPPTPAPPSLADTPSVTTDPAPPAPADPRQAPTQDLDDDSGATQGPRDDVDEGADADDDVPEPSAPASEPTDEVAPVAEPASVSIPAIGVTSDLLHLGLDDQGALAVPEGQDYDSAAWYDGSPRPGQDGPAVILGHVSGAAGPSVFFDLARLQVGDTVEVSRADGTTATFEIYDLRQFPKNTFPTAQVYGNTTGPELRVITCGGTFSDTTGHFDDNIIVFAREV